MIDGDEGCHGIADHNEPAVLEQMTPGDWQERKLADEEALQARNMLARVLDDIEGGHSTSLVDCADRAAALLRKHAHSRTMHITGPLSGDIVAKTAILEERVPNTPMRALQAINAALVELSDDAKRRVLKCVCILMGME